MRKIVSLTAAMAVAVLVFSGYALARGGNGGGGRGTGNCPNQSAVSGARPVCDGTGPKRLTSTQTRPMDGTGSRYGQMRGGISGSVQTAPTDSATTPAN